MVITSSRTSSSDRAAPSASRVSISIASRSSGRAASARGERRAAIMRRTAASTRAIAARPALAPGASAAPNGNRLMPASALTYDSAVSMSRPRPACTASSSVLNNVCAMMRSVRSLNVRSRSSVSPSRHAASESRVTSAATCWYPAMRCMWNAGADRRRWRVQIAPSLTRRPSPVNARSVLTAGIFSNARACSTSTACTRSGRLTQIRSIGPARRRAMSPAMQLRSSSMALGLRSARTSVRQSFGSGRSGMEVATSQRLYVVRTLNDSMGAA